MHIRNIIGRKRELIKYSILIFLGISLLYVILASFYEVSTISLKRLEVESNENRIINLEKNTLGQEFNNVISDILFLADNFKEHDFGAAGYEQIANEWRLFSGRNKTYDQIRLIDISGDEKIRVNYSSQEAYIVDEGELQNKKERYYFQHSIELKKGQIYISKLDLNMENGRIEEPLKPMIRFTTPLYDEAGELKGIIVLNYYAKYLLDNFKTIAETSTGEVFLLNSKSYWVSNSAHQKEWGFMYEDRQNINFHQEHPVEWAYMTKNLQGSIYSDEGLYTFTNVVTLHNASLHESNLRDDKIVLGEGNWIIVSFVPKTGSNKTVLEPDEYKIILHLLVRQKLLFLIIFAVSLVVSVLMVINKISKEEVKYFSEYDAMTNVLNRRAGFVRLNENYQKMLKNKEKMSICFIDINGLKDVNDVLGHEAGDELILTIVGGIRKYIRQADFIIRLGGDEFLVVFINADYDQAEQIWNRMKSEYQRINNEEERYYLVSASHGIEECTCQGNNYIDAIINAADEKMYTEKRKIKKDIQIIRRDRMKKPE